MTGNSERGDKHLLISWTRVVVTMTGIQELFDDIADLRQKSRHIHNAKRRNEEKITVKK